MLQSLKDAIMVTAGGAEALPFLASFCVLPASVAFFVLYGKLVSCCCCCIAAAQWAAAVASTCLHSMVHWQMQRPGVHPCQCLVAAQQWRCWAFLLCILIT
jgi:hypothetical protein